MRSPRTRNLAACVLALTLAGAMRASVARADDAEPKDAANQAVASKDSAAGSAAQAGATPVPTQAPAPIQGPPSPAPAAMRVHGSHARVPTPQPTVQLKPGEVPRIQFDTPTYDFGRIPAGQEVVHDFWFTNSGNGPLEILSVKPS